MGLDPKRDEYRIFRLIEKQRLRKIADDPGRVLDGRINGRFSCFRSLSVTKGGFLELRDADSAEAVGTGGTGKHFSFFLGSSTGWGKQQDPPCKFHSPD